ncbi:MAG: cyanuric acid amidohydrolase [Candidatus Rokuibacteriota bacterium]|nr:MAG: cyanuric acid amidohydrolase [Candidatus Rokubacteria bacterium]
MQRIEIYRLPTTGPDDVSGLARLIDDGAVSARDVIAVLGKTEGNGCVNDWSRGFATSAYAALLAARLGTSVDEVTARVQFIMSGGTEGIITPHVTVFVRRDVHETPRPGRGLVAGVASTRVFKAEELGTTVQVREVEAGVRTAMADAGIRDAADVHFVQIKCPLLTAEAMTDAAARGARVATTSAYGSMGYSRGASALGVALALGEVERGLVTDGAVCKRWDLFSRVASTSAGVELSHCELIVLGNAEDSASDLVIGHDVMEDAIDAGAVRRAMRAAGCDGDGAGRVVGVYAKAEASPTGRIRGRRHTMIDDSDINHTRHARAVVGGVIASVIGDPMVYVSGGAEHQGPSGGGPVAVIGRRA